MERCLAGHADGIGFAFAEGDELAGIDLDHCYDGQAFNPIAMEIIDKFDGRAYVEKSVSGDGIHLIVKGELARCGKGSSAAGLNWIEGYDHTSPRYFTFSGHRCEGISLEEPMEAQEALNWLTGTYLKQAEKTAPDGTSAPVFDAANEAEDDALIAQIRRSKTQGDKFAQLFDTGNLVDTKTGECRTVDESALDMMLIEMLAYYCSRDEEQMDRIFRRSALMRDEWDSKRGNTTYGGMTIAKGLKYNLEKGGKAFKDRISEKAEEFKGGPDRYTPLKYSDLMLLPPSLEIVEDLLPSTGSFCIFGQSAGNCQG